MGQDKGSMIMDQKPMVLHVLEKLEGHVNEVVLVLRDEDQLKSYEKIMGNKPQFKTQFSFNLKFVTDLIKNQGPLAGIYTGLNHVKSDYALVIPCDSPYISPLFIENIYHFLEKSNKKYDAFVSVRYDKESEDIIPDKKVNTDHIQPLHSIYHEQCKEKIELQLSKGKRDVKSLIKNLNVFFIDLDKLDPSQKSFVNLNKPEDLN